jgi:adenine-specific DNA-methyltransferase
LPRDVTSADALVKSKRECASLKDYGYKARVGVYVWNRDKRRVRKARPKGRDRKIAVPVVWATHIGQDGRFRFVSRTHKEKRARYILLRPGDRRGVIERDCVLIQRTSSRAQRRRLVAAAPRRGFAKRHGGFVGENHIIILEPILDRPLVPRHMLTRLLNSEFIRDLYSTTTGTTAVTTAGLRVLPLPDPRLLKELVGRRHSLKHAIRTAFGARTTNKHSNMDDAKATAP